MQINTFTFFGQWTLLNIGVCKRKQLYGIQLQSKMLWFRFSSSLEIFNT